MPVASSSVHPSRWNVSSGMVAPEHRWAWDGLRTVVVPTPGSPRVFDPVNRVLTTLEGSPAVANTTEGSSLRFTEGQTQGIYWPDSTWLPNDACTVALLHRRRDDTDNSHIDFGIGGDATPPTSDRIQVALPWSDGVIYWDFGNNSGDGRDSASLSTAEAGEWAMYFLMAGPSGMQIHRNREELASQVDSLTRTDSDQPFYLGNGASSGNGLEPCDNDDYAFFAIWDYELTPDQRSVVIDQPIAPFKPRL